MEIYKVIYVFGYYLSYYVSVYIGAWRIIASWSFELGFRRRNILSLA